MPIYDFKCSSCGGRKNDVFVPSYDDIVRCPQCGAPMSKLVPTGVVGKVFPANGIFLEHVSPKGKRFFSTEEMRRYEREHDVELGALL